MIKNKLLSIVIPTWNRSNLLKELLDQLTNQISKYILSNHIEIIISDNYSTDDTYNLCQKYISKYDYILYNRNSGNFGAKYNVIKSLYLASSAYVLLLGDDDRIRKDCLPDILTYLKNHPSASLIIDKSRSKRNNSDQSLLSLVELLLNYYWYMGNAGAFVIKNEFIKQIVDTNKYDYFNECWPQTQIMILSLIKGNEQIFVTNLNIIVESKHNDVMIYSSYYLWRTCVLELYNAVNDIKTLPLNILSACRTYMKNNIKQVFFNILQCGIFVDSISERKKTKKHIQQHLNRFELKEKIYLLLIIMTFSLPLFLTSPLSNLFILITKGKTGLKRKNNFVSNELIKKSKLDNRRSGSIRILAFEKD